MKALFKAIRKGRFDEVRGRIEKDPSLVNCRAKAPPKGDDGQSPLQVAFKTGNFEICHYLMDHGADINFMEESDVNEWRTPVVHDAIRACVMSSRFQGYGGLVNTQERFEEAFTCLQRIVAAGADLKATDSYGNNGIMRAAMDADRLQISDTTPEVKEDLAEVFKLLIEHGADVQEATETRKSVLEQFGDRPVVQFFTL